MLVTLDFPITPWSGICSLSQLMKIIHFQPCALYNSRMPNPVSSPEKAAIPKRPVGRPTAYRPEMCQQLIETMAGGHSAEAGAAKIGISAWNLYECSSKRRWISARGRIGSMPDSTGCSPAPKKAYF